MTRSRVGWTAGLVLAVGLPFVVPTYFVDLLSRVLVFAIMAIGLNLIMGYGGLPSLGQSAFLTMGAYTAGLLTVRLHMNFVPASLAAILTSALLGALFGLIALRARGATFLLITLALAQSLWAVAFTWRALTRGDDGLGGVPRPEIGSLALTDPHAFYFFVLVVFLALFGIMAALVRSPFGLALQGIRDNEQRLRSLGCNTWLLQYLAFIIAAVFAGVAGLLRAYLVGAVVPEWSLVDPSAEALLMVILGGPATLIGPVVGAAIIEPGAEIAGFFTQRWLLVLGVLYVAVVLLAPEGIVGWLQAHVPWRRRAAATAARPLAVGAAAPAGEAS